MTYVKAYRRKDGTIVSSHYRSQGNRYEYRGGGHSISNIKLDGNTYGIEELYSEEYYERQLGQVRQRTKINEDLLNKLLEQKERREGIVNGYTYLQKQYTGEALNQAINVKETLKNSITKDMKKRELEIRHILKLLKEKEKDLLNKKERARQGNSNKKFDQYYKEKNLQGKAKIIKELRMQQEEEMKAFAERWKGVSSDKYIERMVLRIAQEYEEKIQQLEK